MWGAGTIDDIWDQDIDKYVERSKERPLTSGQISTNDNIVFVISINNGLIILSSLPK